MNRILKSSLIGIVSSFLFFFLTGITTAVIPNSFYIRMTPVGWWEYVVFILTSILLGVYIGLHAYRTSKKACTKSVLAGSILGFLTFGCSICNALLVALLGTVGVLTYFEPVRPWLGALAIVLLVTAVFYQLHLKN